MDFHEMGIKDNELLNFIEDPSITVIIHGSKKVIYQNTVMSLTAATREILGLDYSIQPSPRWTYKGRLLKDIYEEYYSDGDEE